MSSFKLSRRAALKGFGAALALPALECMAPSRALAQSAPSAQRFIGFFVPNGIRMDRWTPSREGALELTPILRPLEPVRDSVLVLSGLDKRPAEPLEGEFGGGHARGTSTFLTCAHPFKTTEDIQLGVSIDQAIAQRVGRDTRLPSLVVGCEPVDNSGQCDFGYSCAYKNNISWSTPSSPVPRDTSPFQVYQRLFGNGNVEDKALLERRAATRRSVLDFVRADAARLRARLGARDRQKLDQYETSVREVERRILSTTTQTCDAGDAPIAAPLDRDEHARQLLDLMVLAMQCDLTRVGTFMLANGASGQSLPFLGFDDAHHEVSHHQDNDEKLEKWQAINTWSVDLFAHLLGKLRDAELLDDAVCVFGTEITDGNRHDYTDMPILVGGGGLGAGGRHVRFAPGTPLANLYVSSMQAMGVEQSHFGDDGTGPLDLG
jgi:hypothetical protein